MSSMPLESVSVLLITILAVISPGPDFALVSSVSINKGKLSGVLCALGIGLGISVHLLYTLVGLGLLLSQTQVLLDVMRIIGAAYLIWLGGSALWPDLRRVLGRHDLAKGLETDSNGRTSKQGGFSPFLSGFICNAFNPKTMLFIVALFSQVVSKETGIWVQLGYGIYIALVHFLWFSCVAIVLNAKVFQGIVYRAKAWLERASGGVMLVFGVGLLFPL